MQCVDFGERYVLRFDLCMNVFGDASFRRHYLQLRLDRTGLFRSTYTYIINLHN